MKKTEIVNIKIDPDLKERIRIASAMVGSSGSNILRLGAEYITSLEGEELQDFLVEAQKRSMQRNIKIA